jgi:hypothetical protein
MGQVRREQRHEAGIYKAQMNTENPVGTMQSIEHALRSLDNAAADERERTARAEKMLGDFQEQAGKPFEHEARLRELLARQAEVNAALDLDKGERQIAPPAGDEVGAENGGGAGGDERAADFGARGETRHGPARRDRPRPGDDAGLVASKAVVLEKPVSRPRF